MKEMRLLRIISEWYGRIQFKSKVMVAYLPLIILSLFILGLLSSQLFTSSIIERTKQNVQDESSLILAKLDSTLNNTEICANLLVADLNRLYEIFPVDRSGYEEFRFRNMLQSRLAIDLSLFSEVDAAVFVGTDGAVYTSYSASRSEKEVFRSGMLERLSAAGNYGRSQWFAMETRNFLTSDPDVPVLTLGKVVIDINTGRVYGSLFLLIKEPTISRFMGGSGNEKQEQYYLVDDRMKIISSPDRSLLLTSALNRSEVGLLRQPEKGISEILERQGQRNLFTVSKYDFMGWQLVHFVSVDLLTKDIRQNIWLTIMIGLICVALSWFTANILSKWIVGPLLQLTKAMRRFMDGDLVVTANVTTQDEVGLLTKAFNVMVNRIRELVVRVEEEQARKREYELALITAQIKPHFLYNTLDTIYVLNDMDRHDEARDTTKALADFYRMVLSKGRELILLGQEARIVGDYLAIMQVRYADVFHYEIDIPEQLAGAPIPKLSLQPLVENAIYHGLKAKGKLGFIRISAFAEAGKVTVRVEDDGVGMSPQQIQTILSASTDSDEQRSIGIYSVQERLKLYFGEEYGISITSKADRGTIVELTIPSLKTGGSYHV